jgi:hypothetical protein
MPKELPQVPTGEDKRSFLTKWLEGVRKAVNGAEQELDNAGVERKQLDEEGMETLRTELGEMLPGVEAEQIDAVIQKVADAVIIPEDVEEEIVEAAMEEEEKEKSEEVVELGKQVTQLAKDYSGVYSDIGVITESTIELIKQMQLVAETLNTRTKAYGDLEERMKTLEKDVSSKPRRASQSPETEVDENSDIAKQMKQRTFEPPAIYADMFEGGA